MINRYGIRNCLLCNSPNLYISYKKKQMSVSSYCKECFDKRNREMVKARIYTNCKRCGVEKEHNYHSRCKECVLIANRENRQKNPKDKRVNRLETNVYLSPERLLLISNFINKIEKRKRWITMEELFIEMITIWNEVATGSFNLRGTQSAGSQLKEMYDDLYKICNDRLLINDKNTFL